MIAALAGGVGAAKFLDGLVRVVDPSTTTAIVNVADDEHFHGLHVSPDLDSVTYMLGGVNNLELGWGRAGETFRTVDELARFGAPTWFRLGDLDLATHIHRTERLRQGASLSTVTAEITAGFAIAATILPVSDDPIRTRIITGSSASPVDLAMQEWFVRDRCQPTVLDVRFDGADTARPAPGVIAALEQAESIVICPSNPVISIGPILAVPGVTDVLTRRRHKVVAVSPIIGGAPVKGPADKLMAPLGIEVSALGVARHYREFCSAIVIDRVDDEQRSDIEALGMRAVVTETLMRDSDVAADLARTALAAIA